MKKNYLSIILIISAFSMTGCVGNQGLTFSVTELPEGINLTVLVKESELPEREERDLSSNDWSVRQIKCRYNSEGWASVYAYNRFVSERFHHYIPTYQTAEESPATLFLQYKGGTEETVREFCDNFPQIRLAGFDDEGNVLKLSEPISLLQESVYYTVCAVDYNWSTGECRVIDAYERNWHGRTPFSWWVLFMSLTQIAGITVLIDFCIEQVKGVSRKRKKILRIICGILYITMTLAYFAVKYMPMFTWKREFPSLGDFLLLIICNSIPLITVGCEKFLQSKYTEKQKSGTENENNISS